MTNQIKSTNEAIIRRLYHEVLVNWNLEVTDELLSPQFISHDWPNDYAPGPHTFRNFYVKIRSALPDARYEIDDLLSDKDKVIVRWRLLGTHLGDYQGLAPTGGQITLKEIAIYRLENEKVIERWGVTDLHGLLQELKEKNKFILK